MSSPVLPSIFIAWYCTGCNDFGLWIHGERFHVETISHFEQLSSRLLSFSLECIFSFMVHVRVVCYHLQRNSRDSASIFFEEANLSLCFEQSRLVLIKRLLSQTSRGHTRITNECLVKSHVSSTALWDRNIQRKYRRYLLLDKFHILLFIYFY